MSRRSVYPDRLTPREREVLDLLRQGYTNRGIADALGITLAGAKFHVSEIIGKLGVESREEAARWQPEAGRRWGFAPLTAMKAWAGKGGVGALGPGLVAAAAAPALVLGIAAGVLLATSGGRDDTSPAAARAVATPLDPCDGRDDCGAMRERQHTTIEEAARFASFEPMMPAYLPDGYKQHLVLATVRDLTPNEHVANPVDVHNDWITVIYRDEKGSHLVISQGFPAHFALGVYYAVLGQEPENMGESGSVALGDRNAYWLSEGAAVWDSSGNVSRGPHLSFQVGGFGRGWGQPGSYFSGSPMSYAISGESLSLDELVRIAESIDLPELLPPLGDATPPSGW